MGEGHKSLPLPETSNSFMTEKSQSLSMDSIVSLCARRGFIFPSSDIYGGINGFWDFGPLGVELKRNIKNLWWKDTVQERNDVVGLDCSIVMNPKVWQASGHLQSFTDPMVDCMTCKGRFRTDLVTHDKCPSCGNKNLTEVRHFNLMFKTFVGALEDNSSVAYLRPETCQGIFANFLNVLNTARVKVPFGIAQIGKSFRNEINPRNFIFRSREFEQMELEFFVEPTEESSEKWFEYWTSERYQWYLNYGIPKSSLHLRRHESSELAHYARACADIEFDFPFGRSELEGIAQRTDYDLKQHSLHSKKDLSYFDPYTQKRYIPYVIEPSAGVDRATLAFLIGAYTEEEERVVMRFHPKIAPVKVAVFPLVNKDGMPEIALKLFDELKKYWPSQYDDKGAIGRRYRRQDEIGTPYCVTIDGDSLKDQTVTLRSRDTMQQQRVGISHVPEYLSQSFPL